MKNWHQKTRGNKKTRKKRWKILGRNKIVYMNGKIYMLNDRKIREKILQENHKLVDIEHLWQQHMMEQNKVQHIKKIKELYLLKILEIP